MDFGKIQKFHGGTKGQNRLHNSYEGQGDKKKINKCSHKYHAHIKDKIRDKILEQYYKEKLISSPARNPILKLSMPYSAIPQLTIR